MKIIFQKTIFAMLILATSAAIISGCAEHRYYHRYHHHRREWYPRHQQRVPSGVNFDIDVVR